MLAPSQGLYSSILQKGPGLRRNALAADDSVTGLLDLWRKRRKAQDKGVHDQFETFLIVQRLQKRCSHLVQDKTTDQTSKHADCVLSRCAIKASFSKNAQYEFGKFEGCLTPFRAVGGSCPKGCRRQTGML